MRNIFILYMPPGNGEAMIHYQDTIKNRVSQEKIFKYIDSNLQSKLINIFGSNPIATWGSRSGENNKLRFSKMQPGDDVLIIEGDNIKLLGKIADKTVNSNLSRELWKNIKGDSVDGWDLIYFIANPVEINLPFSKLKQLFHYKDTWSLRGFTNISDEKLGEFYDRYDDLYSILIKLKNGEQIQEKLVEEAVASVPATQEEIENTEPVEKELSDHIIMQWKLATLGKKAGSKVWVPRNDQSRLEKNYGFTDYESEFTTGIDTPARYVEQIDVVWKKEFQIDAAFEIENSTSIYSGLLRFADLKQVAPNHNYPLFIVAPIEKRERVINQVVRPSFQKLNLSQDVRYLSYETVNDIDSFFSTSTSGLSADLILGKSEQISI